MKEAKRVAQLGGRPTLLMMTLGLLLLPACSKNDNTTLVNSGVDCGLVRADLRRSEPKGVRDDGR